MELLKLLRRNKLTGSHSESRSSSHSDWTPLHVAAKYGAKEATMFLMDEICTKEEYEDVWYERHSPKSRNISLFFIHLKHTQAVCQRWKGFLDEQIILIFRHLEANYDKRLMQTKGMLKLD